MTYKSTVYKHYFALEILDIINFVFMVGRAHNFKSICVLKNEKLWPIEWNQSYETLTYLKEPFQDVFKYATDS